MVTTHCPACGTPTEYEAGALTIGCSSRACRVTEYRPNTNEAIQNA